MIRPNCLTAALERWHTEGGYVALRTTAHTTRLWRAPRVLHIGPEGLQHFAPGATLGHPVRALVGFDGVVWDRDMADAPPMPLRGIALAAVVGCGGALLWVAGRLVKQITRKLKWQF